jgi:hypothetical protein
LSVLALATAGSDSSSRVQLSRMHVLATEEGLDSDCLPDLYPQERKPSKEAFTNGIGPAIGVTAALALALALAGAIAAFSLPGKRRASKTVLAHAVPALQASS